MKHKTTDEDFQYFVTKCRGWIDKFSLQDWKIYFRHQKKTMMCYRITESDYKRNTLEYWRGKKVKTRKELHNGRIKIPQGTIMTIRGKRGGFSLEGEICSLCKIKAVINRVEPTALGLLMESKVPRSRGGNDEQFQKRFSQPD